MEIVVLSHQDVSALLTMPECIEIMAEALSALARGEVENPLRSVVRPKDARHFFGLMPAYRGGEKTAYALKEVCIFPENPRVGLDAHQGAVLLHSGEDGRVIAVMNASAITAIRTAAVSALATRLLARADAATLAIVGTGVQGSAHLDAMIALDRFRRVLVVGRTPERARECAAEWGRRHAVPVEPTSNPERAIGEADVIVTATNSAEPVLERSWIRPGTHVNAVGSCNPRFRELDTATVADSAFFVDRRESTLREAGDYLIPAQEGAIGPDHIRAEIGEILIGEREGRRSAGEITVFESLGIAIEDLASAQFLHRRAIETGAGARVDF